MKVRLVPALLTIFLALSACGSPPAETPGAATGASNAIVNCAGEQLARMQTIKDHEKVQVAYCREDLAYVRFGGIGVEGRGQSAFFLWKDGDWTAIAWGETSHGSFIYQGLAAQGLDAYRLATLFPEAGIAIPTGKP